MKPLITAAMLLALAPPVFAAGMTATPAQWKDIRAMSNAFLRCDNSEEYDPEIKKACILSRELQDKLAKQGFCTYGRILVGRPSKDGKDCYLLHNYPMHVLIP
jgi:hypothetical protein